MPAFRDMLTYAAPAAATLLFLAGFWLGGAQLFAALDSAPTLAAQLWLAFNGALLLTASAFNVAAYGAMQSRAALSARTSITAFLDALPRAVLFLTHAGLIMLSSAAGMALQSGSWSITVYFGASLLLWASADKRDFAGGAALALLVLQPAVGLCAAAALALSSYGRRVIIMAMLIWFLLAVPSLLRAPAADLISHLIISAAQWRAPSADALTGLSHLVWLGQGPGFGAAFYLILSLGVVCAAGLAARFGRTRSAGRKLKTMDNLMIAYASALLIAPLELADFTLIGVLLLYTASLRAPLATVALIASLIIWRADAAIASLGLGAISVVIFAAAAPPPPRKTPGCGNRFRPSASAPVY